MAVLPVCMMLSPAGAIPLMHLFLYVSAVGAWAAGGYLFGAVLMRGNWYNIESSPLAYAPIVAGRYIHGSNFLVPPPEAGVSPDIAPWVPTNLSP